MSGWDGWDWTLLAVGGYVALLSLVRMMQRRHAKLVRELLAQLQIEKRKQKASRSPPGRSPAQPRPREPGQAA